MVEVGEGEEELAEAVDVDEVEDDGGVAEVLGCEVFYWGICRTRAVSYRVLVKH